MAKSRKEKNKDLYNQLENEMKNNKGNSYEEKLKNIDPNLDASGDATIPQEEVVINKKSEAKNTSALTVIAKKVNGRKAEKKQEIVAVDKKKKKNIEEFIDVEEFNEPISYTDKLSVEEILRAKLEQQQKIKAEKKSLKKGPNDENYTPAMMQERIKPHVGVDVRKEVNLKHKDHKVLVFTILFVALIAVIAFGLLLIFKVI